MWTYILILISAVLLVTCADKHTQEISLKEESLETLSIFANALIKLQINDATDENFGALKCHHCNVLHTRAGEALYPFTVCYKLTGNKRYLSSAISLGNWLIKQQLKEGEWKETPEDWTGTTTDQLLMLAAAYPILERHLKQQEQKSWKKSIKRAADYLTRVMSPDFASINYCATTTSSLVFANMITPDNKYLRKAKILAYEVISRMDHDGFICAEGGRINGLKYGADVGYEIDMSLWGLALYAKFSGDEHINQIVKISLLNHLNFVYPNGSIDGSWGIRSNKWTVYGSATADGCQILFSLFCNDDARYRTAAYKNLMFLRKMHKDGIIGYGPHYFELFESPPCIYPTFVRSKNLAMTIELGDQGRGEIPPLPTDTPGWVREYKTVNVAQIRSEKIMATVTGYRYKDIRGRENSKYMHRPSGGTMSNLWIKDFGVFQTASQTEYKRWEPMHFPEANGILPLTSRIEFQNEDGYFTNLYEFDGYFTVESNQSSVAKISTLGYLKNRRQIPGGVAYRWTHEVFDDKIKRTVEIRYHGKYPHISIVEPLVQHAGVTINQINEKQVEIGKDEIKILLTVLEGDAKIELGTDKDRYWSPYPAFKCYPVNIIAEPDQVLSRKKIVYEISILN